MLSRKSNATALCGIRAALTRPARAIVENAGEEGSVVVGHLLDKYAGNFEWGYDAGKGQYVDMVASGIVDPLKVVKTALIDARSVLSAYFASFSC
jgi:chaperonin GroEL